MKSSFAKQTRSTNALRTAVFDDLGEPPSFLPSLQWSSAAGSAKARPRASGARNGRNSRHRTSENQECRCWHQVGVEDSIAKLLPLSSSSSRLSVFLFFLLSPREMIDPFNSGLEGTDAESGTFEFRRTNRARSYTGHDGFLGSQCICSSCQRGQKGSLDRLSV